MSLSIGRFDEFFRTLWGYDPFPWQARLAKQVFERGWPECIDLPTASGKTACIDIAVLVLACQAGRETKDRTVGRRLFFTVNRRVIVDEAFDRAQSLAQKLLDAKDGCLKEVADVLREISGDKIAPPLDVAQLRGGIYCDRAWARSITQPIVVCTTADQLGSRLLFRGYGVSPSMQPVHAALTGCDSLILLDEAHVTRAFCQTMRLMTKYQKARTATAIPPMHFVQMTATPVDAKDRFELDDADHSHPVIDTRQKATKLAALVKLDQKGPLTEEVVSRAFGALSDTRKAVGIIVNRVQTARDVERVIREEIERRAKKDDAYNAECHLVIGRMRPIDRDDLQGKLRDIVGPGRPDVFPASAKPVFIVATQCLEVGADYDFDVLITECASIDALRQRFGRLNRKGRPIEAAATIIANEESIEGDDPIYGDAIKHTWDWLTENGRNSIDFGIAELKKHWDNLDTGRHQAMLAPAPDAAVLLPAHLDALCQTNPQPVPSPDVSYFIHGPQRDNAEVNVCWRADLGDDAKLWPEIMGLLPPTSPECMTVPLWEVRRWMQGNAFERTDPDADVPVLTNAEVQESDRQSDQPKPPVVIWRYGRKPGVGTDAKRRLVGFTTDDPLDLKPGDTVAMPTSSRSWLELGHIPDAARSRFGRATTEADGAKRAETDEELATRCASLDRSVDIAERATRQARLRVVHRLHKASEKQDRESEGARPLRGLSDSELRKALVDQDVIPADWDHKPGVRLDRHQYPGSGEDAPDEVIVFKRLLDPPNTLVFPSDDEDDGEDTLSERDQLLSLADHTQQVVERADAALGRLSVNGLESSLRESARLHDLGKADVRFQAMLAGITPYEAMMRPALLGKGDGRRLTTAERRTIGARAMLPADFRHEMLSVQIVQDCRGDLLKHPNVDLDLLLHLIAAHHGYARPFAPVCIDDATDDELGSIRVNDHDISGDVRATWIPCHRLDSGVAERFWTLTRKHGWWGLAWLESILRLADQQASAAKQEQPSNQKKETP
jgi:CRISPR-associated endonuclease/helicase Cas3